MGKSIVYQKAFEFAIQIVNTYKYLIEERKQFEKLSTLHSQLKEEV